MLSAILVASIAVAVILGYKTKINTGFFCIAFAYLIGCFGMAGQHHVRHPVSITVLQLCSCEWNP